MYLEKYDLKGRVAVVTGGGRGIGFESARALAECGARVVIAEIDATTGPKAAAELEAMGYAAEHVHLDVTKPAEVTRLADDIQARHGRELGDVISGNALQEDVGGSEGIIGGAIADQAHAVGEIGDVAALLEDKTIGTAVIELF